MTRTNAPAEKAAARNRRVETPEDTRVRRHAEARGAASQLDASHARLSSKLAGEERPAEETETADALKRAAESDRRV